MKTNLEDTEICGIEARGPGFTALPFTWIETAKMVPPYGAPVVGFSPEWVHEDFNPQGFRECFLNGGPMDTFWCCAWWNDGGDCYETSNAAPTHWMRIETPSR
jgi:hypothetical protein